MADPTKRNPLTADEAAVVNAASRALRVPSVSAGYRTIPRPEVEAILARPHVKAAVRARIADKLATESLPLALALLEDVVALGQAAAVGANGEHITQPARLEDRIRAAGKLADLAFEATKQEAAAPPERDLATMSSAELRAFVAHAELELSDRAKPVSAPRSAPLDPQAEEELADLLA